MGEAIMIVPILAGSKHYPTITFNPADADPLISFANGNRTAIFASGSGWKSGRATGSYKSAGKAYFSCSIDNTSNFMGAGFATSSTPLSNLLGNAAGQGILVFCSGGTISIWYHGTGIGGGGLSSGGLGAKVVVALNLGTGDFWTTVQSAGGVLNTNWNSAANSPAAGTGSIATDLGGVSVIPGASLLNGGAQTTIDANTLISDPTLLGFVPWARL